MRKLQLNDTEFSLPGNWNELTPTQLLVLANMIIHDKMTVEEIKIKMLFTAMEAHVTHHKVNGTYTLVGRKNKFDLTSSEVLAMASIFDFLFVETDKGMELRSKLTKNPYPILPCKCSSRLVGPADGLADLTYEQAIEAESFLYDFSKSKNPDDFCKFVSALYHTGSRFDIEKLESNAKRYVSYASPAVLHVVYLFWCGCMDMITNLYPNCFSGSNDEMTAPKKPFENHRDIIYKLADGDITKETTIEKIEMLRVYHVLNTKIEEYEKQKAEFDKLKYR